MSAKSRYLPSGAQPQGIINFKRKDKTSVGLKSKHVVEGILMNAISDITTSLNVFYASQAQFEDIDTTIYENYKTYLKHADNMTALYVLSNIALNKAVAELAHFKDSSLNARHRATRNLLSDARSHFQNAILQKFFLSEEFKNLSNSEVLDDTKSKLFIRDLCSLLGAFHYTLHADSQFSDRSAVFQELKQAWKQTDEILSA